MLQPNLKRMPHIWSSVIEVENLYQKKPCAVADDCISVESCHAVKVDVIWAELESRSPTAGRRWGEGNTCVDSSCYGQSGGLHIVTTDCSLAENGHNHDNCDVSWHFLLFPHVRLWIGFLSSNLKDEVWSWDRRVLQLKYSFSTCQFRMAAKLD